MESSEKLLHFLEELHDDFQPLTKKLKFDTKREPHLAIMTLYGTVLELIGSCIFLLRNKKYIGISILLRSILEAYVDLINLMEDENYFHYLHASFLQETLKFINSAKKENNPQIEALLANWEGELEKREGILTSLSTRGFKPLKNCDKFEKAGLEKLYITIYNHLCCESHNNLISLTKRHVKQNENKTEIIFYKTSELHDSIIYIEFMINIFLDTTEKLHMFLGGSDISVLLIYKEKLAKIATSS
ncbi:MAG: DUF5677 domain-containing protein [Gammaproteobacteria bacterium]